MTTSYNRAVKLYQAFHGISDEQMPSDMALKASPGVRRLAFEAAKIVNEIRLTAMKEALEILQTKADPKNEILSILDGMQGNPAAIEAMKEAETIELTEVHGGGFNQENSNPTVQIATVEEAIQSVLDGRIAGFQIGGCIEGKWSPVGVIRKWGDKPNVCQIKSINHLGQEGSGVYDDVNSNMFGRFLQNLIKNATISSDSKLHEIRRKLNHFPLTEEECKPKFKAL